MKNTQLKELLHYAAIPLLMLALYIIKRETLDSIPLLLREAMLIFGYTAALDDLKGKRVPNGLIGTMFCAWILIMVPQLFFQTEQALSLLVSGIGGFLIGGGVFLVVYLVSRKGIGGGDVKLMAVSGLYLGANGALPSMLYGSVFAAAVGGVMLLSKRIGRKDTIPLVPFLYIGMLLTMFIQ